MCPCLLETTRKSSDWCAIHTLESTLSEAGYNESHSWLQMHSRNLRILVWIYCWTDQAQIVVCPLAWFKTTEDHDLLVNRISCQWLWRSLMDDCIIKVSHQFKLRAVVLGHWHNIGNLRDLKKENGQDRYSTHHRSLACQAYGDTRYLARLVCTN